MSVSRPEARPVHGAGGVTETLQTRPPAIVLRIVVALNLALSVGQSIGQPDAGAGVVACKALLLAAFLVFLYLTFSREPTEPPKFRDRPLRLSGETA